MPLELTKRTCRCRDPSIRHHRLILCVPNAPAVEHYDVHVRADLELLDERVPGVV